MNTAKLWSLRLGFSTHEAEKIKQLGLKKYTERLLSHQTDLAEPDFLNIMPRDLAELKALKLKVEQDNIEKMALGKLLNKTARQWKAWYAQRMFETENPLREKINLFWHNHFVSTNQSVRMPHWIFKHYETIHRFGTANYKTLVKEMISSNALIKYLDNQQNKKGKINENLARETMELFTLGEGHYSENEVKNAARAFAGMSFGPEKGQYYPRIQDHEDKTFFGKTGNFDYNDIVDIIFEQKNTPYFITEKILKWFLYDQPSKELIVKYGDYLKEKNFELKPFFVKIFTDEELNTQQGTQIKNPLIFIFQILKDLNIKEPNYELIAYFLKNQGMDLYDQQNVKGWQGGQDWISSQIYTNRKQLVDYITVGNPRFANQLDKNAAIIHKENLTFAPVINFDAESNAHDILAQLTDDMVFKTDDKLQEELNQLLKYDFDAKTENAAKYILNVYNFLAKSPEFQII